MPEALTLSTFEPLDKMDLKLVALKTELLLALVSSQHVGEIHPLSVHPSCAKLSLGKTRVILLPNPAFGPQVLGSGLNLSRILLEQSPELSYFSSGNCLQDLAWIQ